MLCRVESHPACHDAIKDIQLHMYRYIHALAAATETFGKRTATSGERSTHNTVHTVLILYRILYQYGIRTVCTGMVR